jgi:predicted PurR-regulated permease PerM
MTKSIANKPFVKVLCIIGIIILALWIASFVPDLVLTLIVSTLLAFILQPIVRFMEFHWGIRRSIAIAIVFFVLGGSIVIGLVYLVPFFFARISTMYGQLQHFPLEQKLTLALSEITKHIPFVDQSSLAEQVHANLQKLMQSLNDLGGAAVSYLVNIVIVPFITYFILAEGNIGIKKLVERIPNKYFEMMLNVIHKLQRELTSYLRGLLLESSLVGCISIVGLTIIGVPYAIILGIITGVANIVPYLGPIVGAGLAVLVSLITTGDFQMLAPIIILALVTRLADDLILQPICFGKSLDMHPVAVVLTLIIGHQLMGVSGMVISIPIATILRVSATETYWGLKNYTITA